ncbi:MAG: succinate dehydrogenase [Burkholderiaceae bacterium]
MTPTTLIRVATVVHRVSGIGLALFVPLHLMIFSRAVHSEQALGSALALARLPGLKAAEWCLLALLFAHLFFGVRVLLIEFDASRSIVNLRTSWVLPGLLLSVVFASIALFVGR